MDEGPQLEVLLHRLAECPADFLLGPGEIDLMALVCDHWRVLGLPIPSSDQRHSLDSSLNDYHQVIAIVLWLLRDDWFLPKSKFADAIWKLLHSRSLRQLSQLVRGEVMINDADRREELVRLCLKELGLRPEGESDIQAADRLTTLDSVERERVIRETRRTEFRAREIREAMARKQAEEAAARYSPE